VTQDGRRAGGGSVSLACPWSDAVFHVLAHVRATASLASSVFDARYVATAERALGPASERGLGEDARVLGEILPTFAALARVQALAWLFDSVDRVNAIVDRPLDDLTPEEVDAPRLLGILKHDPAAEVLRAAAELELPLLDRLPPVAIDRVALAEEVARVAPAAPFLAACEVTIVRSLGHRGRVIDRAIAVGDAPLPHAAWQAAHEATVAEILDAPGPAPDHDVLERGALRLLARRARDAGLADAHRTWLDPLGPATVALALDAAPIPR
jgi:hypothetical protein